MEQELRELTTSHLPPATTIDETNKSSRTGLYERPPTAKGPVNHRPTTEEDCRLLLEKDMFDAHENGIWVVINRKCLFVSSFTLNWTDVFAYCKSFTAQLLTLSTTKMYSTFTLYQISSLVSLNSNYFNGLSEQPNDSS